MCIGWLVAPQIAARRYLTLKVTFLRPTPRRSYTKQSPRRFASSLPHSVASWASHVFLTAMLGVSFATSHKAMRTQIMGRPSTSWPHRSQKPISSYACITASSLTAAMSKCEMASRCCFQSAVHPSGFNFLDQATCKSNSSGGGGTPSRSSASSMAEMQLRSSGVQASFRSSSAKGTDASGVASGMGAGGGYCPGAGVLKA
mmetsp:Transcript_36515/g.113643  ORF Transcript_36515/g.113643 Transcript_36515/m.113643 type:complete len:201 (+) Transcript_36515:346-948(+)